MVKKSFQDKEIRLEIIYWRWLVGFILVCLLLLLVILQISNVFLKGDISNNLPERPGDMVLSNLSGATSTVDKFTESYNEQLQAGKYYAAIMIDNHFDVWEKQFALSLSPFVYNVPVEGGVTRFMALFPLDKETEKIGPIRSVRPYFLDLFSEYASVLVHVGGSPDALARIRKENLPDLNEMTAAGIFFYRDKKIPKPHNTFISTEDLNTGIDYFGFPVKEVETAVTFQDSLENGQDRQSIFIDYSARATYDVEYRFNVDFSAYERFRAGEQQFDALTGKSVLVDNIVIERVPSEVILDDKLRIALDVVGKGKALFFINGHKIEGSWEKLSVSEPTHYYDSKGEEIIFKPGNIWIEVVPQGHKVIVE